VLWLLGNFGKSFLGVAEAMEFSADSVAGEAGAEQAVVEGGGVFAVEGGGVGDGVAAEPALNAAAEEAALVGFAGEFLEGGVDVAAGDAAGAEFAGDAERALAAIGGAVAGELAGVAGVVEIAAVLEAGEDAANGRFLTGPPLEVFPHIGDGVGAAGQRADGGGVELILGGEAAGLAWSSGHGEKSSGSAPPWLGQ
jgi:hypothetical protein